MYEYCEAHEETYVKQTECPQCKPLRMKRMRASGNSHYNKAVAKIDTLIKKREGRDE